MHDAPEVVLDPEGQGLLPRVAVVVGRGIVGRVANSKLDRVVRLLDGLDEVEVLGRALDVGPLHPHEVVPVAPTVLVVGAQRVEQLVHDGGAVLTETKRLY